MARNGVNYEQVAAVASQLVHADEPVTVDNVRIRLGGTGSKSTIAPLLKRWKTENVEQMRAPVALPRDLLHAVQRLYEEVDQRFKGELAAAELTATLRIDEYRAKNKMLGEELAARDQACRTLEEGLMASNAKLASVVDRLDTARAEIKERETAQDYLERRIEERASEVENLHDQLSQAHRQFNHFQTATQRRWEEEQKRNETKLTDALRTNERLRETLQHVETQFVTVQAQLAQVTSGYEQLSQENHLLQSALDALRQENARREESMRRSALDAAQRAEALATLQHAYDATVAKLNESERRLAVSASRAAMLEASVATADQRAAVARRDLWAPLRPYADRSRELLHCRR
jgi:chromosome segregation ATPase